MSQRTIMLTKSSLNAQSAGVEVFEEMNFCQALGGVAIENFLWEAFTAALTELAVYEG